MKEKKPKKLPLTDREIAIAKALVLISEKWQERCKLMPQNLEDEHALYKEWTLADIASLINLGRQARGESLLNQARFSSSEKELGKYKNIITVATDEEVEAYIEYQKACDPNTGLSTYGNNDERIIRARDEMLTAISSFNNPLMKLRNEICVSSLNKAWTFLISEKMERKEKGSTKKGEYNLSLNELLKHEVCPIKDKKDQVFEDLKLIAKHRNTAEHALLEKRDESFFDLFQRCCWNFEEYLTEWFGPRTSLKDELPRALQIGKCKDSKGG